MSWYDDLGDYAQQGINWISGNQGTENLGGDRAVVMANLKGQSPYINTTSPYANNYQSMVDMLTKRANGNGPSIAGDAYRSASQEALSRQAALSAGGSIGGTRTALQNMANIDQGLSQGYGAARNQEMVGAAGQLNGAIQGADQSDFQRQQANQQAYLQMLKAMYGGDATLAGSQKSNGDTVGGLAKGAAAAFGA